MAKESKRLPQIKFSKEWDKLKDPTFSTIRSYDPKKEAWYRGLVGEKFRVRLVKKPYGWSYHDKTLMLAFLRKVERVNPRVDVDRKVLVKDVHYQGKPDGEWLERIILMDDALLLTFDRAPEVTLD